MLPNMLLLYLKSMPLYWVYFLHTGISIQVDTETDRRCFLHDIGECPLLSQTDRSHETSVFHSSNLHADLQVRLHISYRLDTFTPDICATILLSLASPPPHSFSVAVWVLRGPIVSCCSPGAHSAAVGWRSLQSSPTDQVPWASGHRPPPVPWASCRGSHSPVILPSKVATWRSVSGLARWLCAVEMSELLCWPAGGIEFQSGRCATMTFRFPGGKVWRKHYLFDRRYNYYWW